MTNRRIRSIETFNPALARPDERFRWLIRQTSVLAPRIERVGIVMQAGADQVRRADVFARLVDRRALDRAYRYATLILGSRSDAEDATHDAALMAWRRFGDLRDVDRFDAWFGRILVNACRDRLRQRGRSPVSLDDGPTEANPPLLATTAGASDQAEAIAHRDVLAEGLRSLSPEHREVIVLRFYLDLTVDEIAARTGTRSGTVKSRLHHALRRLRQAVEPSFDTWSDR